MTTDRRKNLPTGWVEAGLQELVVDPRSHIVDGPFGSNLKASEYVEQGLPIIRLQNIARNHFINKNIRFISHRKAEELQRHGFKAGDIVISKLGDPLGEACIVPESLQRGVIIADVVRVRLPDGIVNKTAITYALNAEPVQGQFEVLTKGTTRPRVNLSHIRTIRLPLPPLGEQARIVEEIEKQFTRLDAAVAALKRVRANLKRYRAAVLKAACEGRLVPTEAELARAEGRPYERGDELLARILAERRFRWEADQLLKMRTAGKLSEDDKWKAKYKEPISSDVKASPTLPEGWVWVTLEQVSWDASYGTSEKCDYEWTGPPVLRIPNVVKGKIDLNDLKFAADSRKLVESDALVPGDMLIVRTNGSRDLIGRCAVVHQPFPKLHFYASYLIRFRLVDLGGLPRWLSMIWDVPANRARIEGLAATSAGQYNISVTKLSRLTIPLPPTNELQRVVAEVERRLSVMDELEMQIEANLKRAERLRQAILNRAFEGKLVPQDPNDEPAGILLERIRGERAQCQAEQRTREKPRGRTKKAPAGGQQRIVYG